MVVLRLATSYAFGISTGRWRYVGTRDVTRLVASTLTASLVLFLLTWELRWFEMVPRSVIIIDLFLYTWLTAGVWMLYRTVFEQFRSFSGQNGELVRVLIVGAGMGEPVRIVDLARNLLQTLCHAATVRLLWRLRWIVAHGGAAPSLGIQITGPAVLRL